MRLLAVSVVVACIAVSMVIGEEPLRARQVYRWPLYTTRPAILVEPERGLPLTFENATFSLGQPAPFNRLRTARLRVLVGSRTIRVVPVSGITLRLAFGPLPDGMVTFRMRPGLSEPDRLSLEPLVRLTPNTPPAALTFVVADEDAQPGLMALAPTQRVVFTVERLDGEEGPPIFENPDATELLWEALGRPTFSQ